MKHEQDLRASTFQGFLAWGGWLFLHRVANNGGHRERKDSNAGEGKIFAFNASLLLSRAP
jgi:hypothetical protein